MTFTYEPITPADRDRMEALNIMIGWKKPNATDWSVRRTTGDFLVRIAPDREPPHWTWFAFWWRARLFRVGLDNNKAHPRTGYHLEVAWLSEEGGKVIPKQDWSALGDALFEAVKAYAAASAIAMGLNLRERGEASFEPAEMKMECTQNPLGTTPNAIFHVNYTRSTS